MGHGKQQPFWHIEVSDFDKPSDINEIIGNGHFPMSFVVGDTPTVVSLFWAIVKGIRMIKKNIKENGLFMTYE